MNERIVLGHGGGGRLSRAFVEHEIVKRFGAAVLQGLPDAARLNLSAGELLFSTDSFVVQPIFFPGGNIGDLAVYGTINDLAVSGGRPLYLSLGLIIEEGLEMAELGLVLDSVKAAAERCQVQIVTGDTKVVGRGQADKLFINSAGIAQPLPGFSLSSKNVQTGDLVLVSGSVGDHGMAVMAARNGFQFGADLKSDSAPVHQLVLSLADLAGKVRIMRDPTRGGVAAVLNEMVVGSNWGVVLEELQLPYTAAARAAAEILGIDLLNVACEGRLLAICAEEIASEVLSRWQQFPEGRGAAVIGKVSSDIKEVVINTVAGGERFVDWPAGELLPRIC